MQISIVGSIRTPYGEVTLIPQDRNLLQASSVEPFQYGVNRLHLWAMLERMYQTWGVSRFVEPLLHMIDGSSHISSIAGESIGIEVLKSVSSLAGEWAEGHPEAFECAAAAAFEFDREGLGHELGALRESLTCSAQAIESMTAEASSEHNARLRAYSQSMRTMAFEVPTIQQITQALKFHGADFPPAELLESSSRGAPAANTKAIHLRNVTGGRKNSSPRIIAGPTVSGQSLRANQLTLGRCLKKQRVDMGLSQQELAHKLGVKEGHVAQLESDSGPRPSFQLLTRVADVLGLDKDQLFQLAERATTASSAGRRAVSRSGDTAQVWGAFARNRALLDRHNVRPQELKALREVSLMGKITGSEALLFILNAIRDSEDTEE